MRRCCHHNQQKHYHAKALNSYAYPETPLIMGRIMAVRDKRDMSDVCYICAYFPPASSSNAEKISKAMIVWLNKLLSKSPLRCIPIMYMDANTRFGINAQGDSIMSMSVGPLYRGKENVNGSILRKFLEKHKLVLVTTLKPQLSSSH